MMAKHFPTHTAKFNPEYNFTKIVTTEISKSEYKPWITQSHVRRVLLKFKSKKSPGPDKIKPIIFKHLPKNTLEIISFIYRACLKLHYTPRAWKESIVVFIPKQGKTSYQEPKSFRPISLSNYLLKGLEKLLVEQMDMTLEDQPINKNQHGFQRGLSTETAISKTVNYMEKHINTCLLYTSPSPRDRQKSRMPSSA